MRLRNKDSSESSKPRFQKQSGNSSDQQECDNDNSVILRSLNPNRPPKVILTLFVIFMYGSWSVYQYQFQNLPRPLTAKQVGKRGFSEIEAMKHVKTLAGLGPHSVGSDALDRAMQYVMSAAETINSASHREVHVEVDNFHVTSGANRLHRGLFIGKTLMYADLNHIVIRISPKYVSEAKENAILVSSHVDTVFSTGGAGDCSSCVAVILELARGISQWAHGFKNSVIFLLNTGEEEGLNGAHSFITQHPWSDTVRVAIDLEAMGIGGKSSIFQTGSDSWAIEKYAMVAKYPSAQILSQDLFSSVIIKSATDFQIYRDVAGLSGMDFAFSDNTAVYHTKNDKVELLRAGSLQHLGENMLAFLLKAAGSPSLANVKASVQENASDDPVVYFDILGTYMVVYRQKLATWLQNSVIAQSLLLWIMSLVVGGSPAVISFGLSCFSVILTWIVAVAFSVVVAFLLPYVTTSAIPYISSPWLVVGLFGSPAILGALAGQHIGFVILQKYLSRGLSKRKDIASPAIHAIVAKLEAERWIFKSGILQWLVILLVGNYYKVGSSYLALVWLVSPVFAYGLLEATLAPARLPKPLKITTLLIGLSLPVILSGGAVLRVIEVAIGTSVRFERNPGGFPEWLGNVVVSVVIAALVCLMFVYLLSYVHLSGAKRSVIFVCCTMFGLSLAAVLTGIVPPYTEDIARAVNAVHVVDATGSGQNPVSYVSLFSNTPGKLTREITHINGGFVCGKDVAPDFVTFSVKYGCWTYDDAESGWSELDIPTLHVESDRTTDTRITQVLVDMKIAKRWALAINTQKIEDFAFTENSEVVLPLGDKTSAVGWHVVQFAGGKDAPTKFNLTLIWAGKSTQPSRGKDNNKNEEDKHLIKLRTDVDRMTPKLEKIMMKFPGWCSFFGKSTSPHKLAFLTSLPVDF